MGDFGRCNVFEWHSSVSNNESIKLVILLLGTSSLVEEWDFVAKVATLNGRRCVGPATGRYKRRRLCSITTPPVTGCIDVV